MTWTETSTMTPSGVGTNQGEWGNAEVVSPFVRSENVGQQVESGEVPIGEWQHEFAGEVASFMTEQMLSGEWEAIGAAVTPFAHGAANEDREVFAQEIMNEMVGTELGEALGELAQEWSGVHAEHSSMGEMEVSDGHLREASMMLTRHSDELAGQAEQYLATMAELVGERELTSFTETEVNGLLEQMEAVPLPVGASPAQEQFFKAIGRAIGKAVRGVVRLEIGRAHV